MRVFPVPQYTKGYEGPRTDFRETLGPHAGLLLFRHGDPDDLARRLEHVLALDPAERTAIGRELRDRVVRLHGLDRLAGRLLEVLRECGAPDPSAAAQRSGGPGPDPLT